MMREQLRIPCLPPSVLTNANFRFNSWLGTDHILPLNSHSSRSHHLFSETTISTAEFNANEGFHQAVTPHLQCRTNISEGGKQYILPLTTTLISNTIRRGRDALTAVPSTQTCSHSNYHGLWQHRLRRHSTWQAIQMPPICNEHFCRGNNVRRATHRSLPLVSIP